MTKRTGKPIGGEGYGDPATGPQGAVEGKIFLAQGKNFGPVILKIKYLHGL